MKIKPAQSVKKTVCTAKITLTVSNAMNLMVMQEMMKQEIVSFAMENILFLTIVAFSAWIIVLSAIVLQIAYCVAQDTL